MYGSIIDLGIQAAQGQIEGYSYACVVPADNRLIDWAIWLNFPRGYFYRNPDSTITDACTVDLYAPLGVWAMEVLHMLTRFGDLCGIPDSPGGFDIMDCSCGVHPSSFTKRKFGWLDSNQIVTVPIETRSSHVILEALASPFTRGGTRAAIVPILGTQGYFMIEARLIVDNYERNTSGVSGGIPEEGVVVYWVDDESSWPPVHLRMSGMVRPDDKFIDRQKGVEISVTAKMPPSGFSVLINRIEPQVSCDSIRKSLQTNIFLLRNLQERYRNTSSSVAKRLIAAEIRTIRSLIARLRYQARINHCNLPTSITRVFDSKNKQRGKNLPTSRLK